MLYIVGVGMARDLVGDWERKPLKIIQSPSNIKIIIIYLYIINLLGI